MNSNYRSIFSLLLLSINVVFGSVCIPLLICLQFHLHSSLCISIEIGSVKWNSIVCFIQLFLSSTNRLSISSGDTNYEYAGYSSIYGINWTTTNDSNRSISISIYGCMVCRCRCCASRWEFRRFFLQFRKCPRNRCIQCNLFHDRHYDYGMNEQNGIHMDDFNRYS